MKSIAEIKKDVFAVQCETIESSSLPPSLCDNVLIALREAYYNLTLAQVYLEDAKLFDEV